MTDITNIVYIYQIMEIRYDTKAELTTMIPAPYIILSTAVFQMNSVSLCIALSYLSIRELLAIRTVCKFWNDCTLKAQLWKAARSCLCIHPSSTFEIDYH